MTKLMILGLVAIAGVQAAQGDKPRVFVTDIVKPD
jgi:hypothetical protein